MLPKKALSHSEKRGSYLPKLLTISTPSQPLCPAGQKPRS